MAKPDEAPLVGRSAELALLSKTIDEAAKGAGRSVFRGGEGGNGPAGRGGAAGAGPRQKGWY